MHSQGAHEVAFEQPEGLGQQQRARHFSRYAIHHLAPELVGHQSVELLLGHRVLRARWNRSSSAGKRKPQALNVAFGQHHRGVEADDGKQSRHVQDGLNHMLAHLGLRVVELRRVVPRERGAVVAVVDVAGLAVRVVAQAEGNSGVGLVVVAVVDLDLHPAVRGEIRPVEAVCRKRALPAMQKPVWMLNHPRRVDAHMIRHHVAGQPQPKVRRAVLQVVVCLPAAQVFCDVVVLQRVGGGNRVVVAAQPLDGARCNAALPQANQPKPGDAARCQQLHLLVRDLVETVDVALIFLAELLQPYIGALGHQHHVRHPCLIGAEVFILVERRLVVVCVAAAAKVLVETDELVADEAHRTPRRRAVAELVRPRRIEAHPYGEILLAQHVDGQQDALELVAQVWCPTLADVVELSNQRVGRGQHGSAQRVIQAANLRCHLWPRAEVAGKRRRHIRIDRPLLQSLVLEERVKRLEGGVAVGHPQHQKLFQRGLAVGPSVGHTAQPLLGGEIAAKYRDVGKLLGEGEQELLDLARLGLRGEPAHGLGEHRRVDLLAVALDQRVTQLVDQPHGKQRARVDRASRIGVRAARPGVARTVQSLGQPAARRHIGEDDVSCGAEEKVVNLGRFSNSAGDVKFHFSDASTRYYQYRLKISSGVLDAPGATRIRSFASCAKDGTRLARNPSYRQMTGASYLGISESQERIVRPSSSA